MQFSLHTTRTCTEAKSIFSDAQKVLQANEYIFTLFMYSRATVPIDSVPVVYRGPKKKLKIK
jgi:hypothetical protein